MSGEPLPLPRISEQAYAKGAAIIPAVITLGGCIGAIIGTFLPWVPASGPFENGVSRSGIEIDGKFVTLLALICFGIAAFTLLRRPASLGIGILIFLFGFAELGLVIWVGSNISHAIGGAALGAGVYVSGLGAIAAVAGGIIAMTTKKPRA